MDTKAKVVLAVGGVILAGMVAYVLLPGPKKPSAEELAESSQVKPETPATEPASQPTTAATQAYDPFALPATAPAAGSSLPTGPEHSDPWSVLDNGQGSRGSRTPAGRGIVSPLSGDVESGRGPGNKTWKVASGDSLASISTKVYGSPKYASKIAAANPKANPKHLKAGQTLTLPEIPAAAAAPSTPGSSETTALTGKTYKVVSGDSLRKISQKVYGNQGMWEKIYELNKKSIGSDPARLKVGMVLQLPEGGSH